MFYDREMDLSRKVAIASARESMRTYVIRRTTFGVREKFASNENAIVTRLPIGRGSAHAREE